MPKLTEDLVPGVVTLTTLHKVLQNLLDEKVPIRDMRTILETLAEHAPIQSDPHELTAVVRVALGRAITQQWFPGKDEVHVIGLDTPLERLLLQALQGGGTGRGWRIACWRKLRKRYPVRRCWVRRGIVGEPRAATIIVSLPAPQLAAVSGAVESGTIR